MSLPSSERLPNDINDLPPARQRHIRRQPRSATLAEQHILLDSLVKLTAPTPAFFSRALLGVLTLGVAFYLHNLAILIVAIVILPFQAPLFGLALFPITLNAKKAINSLISLVLLFLITFGAGALAGVFQTLKYPDPLGLYRFSALFWLDMVIVGVSVFLTVLTLTRQGKAPQGMGVLLSYTLLVPIAVIGFGLTTSLRPLWTGALFVTSAHLGLAVIVGVFSFAVLGLPPKKNLGWLVSIVALTVTLAVTSAGLHFAGSTTPSPPPASPPPTRLVIVSDTSIPEIVSDTSVPEIENIPTHTLTPSQIFPTATWTPSPSPTNTATITPQPEPLFGLVSSAVGAVIRESPGFDAVIVTYANNGDLLELIGDLTTQAGTRWFQVITDSGQTGWMLGSLVHTQTPSPTTTD
ncbi:MAG: SH3 domain-containing protein [Brevefilum sp.]